VFNSLEWAALLVLGGLGAFLLVNSSLLNFILLSEVLWVGMYLLAVLYGTYVDAANLVAWALFLLCMATAESVIGLSLLMFRFILFHSVAGSQDDVFGRASSQQKLGLESLHHLND
jgi:NADH:ubiquinone oxidoreductase subunit K